jgi:putative ABC transport system substrate-binding protein
LSSYYFSVVKQIFIGLIACIFLTSGFACARALRLTVVLSEEGGAYQEYSDVLSTRLADKNVRLSVIDADRPLPDSDLVIAAGMKAAITVARARPAAMLAVLIPKEGFGKLLHDFSVQQKAGATAYSAIYLDQPLKRQLDLIAAVLPKTNSIAVLYATPPKELSALRLLAAARKLELNERSVNAESGLFAALQALLLRSDVLLALPDAEIYNTATIRNILLATYRDKVPLIGFSPGYVKAGALCAVFSTPEQIAAQSLSIILEYAETGALPAAQYTKEFEVSVNEQVAHSLGLNIKSVSQLRSEIGAAP